MISTLRRRPSVAAALLLGTALSLAGPAGAAPADDADATGTIAPAEPPATPAPLHRLGAGARQLLLSGEADARDYPVYLTAAEARSHAHLHLTITNAVSVMAEASRLRVLVNDVAVSETPIASPRAEDPGVLDIDLPASLLEPGFNAVRLEVQERHRVDCSLAATYELWTQVDPATAGFTFDGLAASSLSDVADLPALPAAEDGTTPMRLVVPKGTDAAALDRLLRAAEAVSLRGRFAHPAVEVASAPADRPGLDIVAGTADDLKRADLGDLVPDDGAPAALRPGATPGYSTLVLSGQGPAEVDAAVASLGGTDASGTPAGLRALALAGGRPVEGGSALTLRDLGVPTQEFSGRLFRTGFDLLLPPDFYPADYGAMTIRLDAAYAAGLDRGSQILVRVNGHDAASLPLGDRAGDAFRRRPVTVPLGSLRPGLNHVSLEAQLATAADAACDAAATVSAAAGAGGKRFALLDSTGVELPAIARIARMPSLSATAAAGFPYAGRKAPGLLYLPHPDADAVSAAATLLSRAAVAAGGPIDARLALGRDVGLKGPALVVAAYADLPPAVIDAAGLDAEAMRGAWSHIEARSAAGARLRDARALAGRPPAPGEAAIGERDGATLFRRWSDDVSAGQWRLNPGALLARLLEKAAGLSSANLPRWGRTEGRVAVTSDMRLAVAQHEAPGGHGDTWTLVLAPTGETLRSSVLAVTAPDLWSQFDGRAATFDPRSDRLATVQAQSDYFVPTATLSPGNVRLIAAGWMSTEIDAYVLGFLLIAGALGAATAAAVKRYGVKP
ncbi:cellulose biosynthesis cyclic di-GMP-binding regulatory protein BcsB [Lichenibacterium dinghuense]|uniref:cellulose biosynthesis cyclic di-GMP-binding regulatory protein BcsB n=1 Tax=Lichenibacterium dinghuense TaxID=2895977 RepID=UPI001F31CABF|nr:cellulose biosynthesis cyclic di-GMP-binding regulatory protein BcsB [Lichenibacterium sp. 6Y81]